MQKASEIKWKYIKMFVLYFHVNSANRFIKWLIKGIFNFTIVAYMTFD